MQQPGARVRVVHAARPHACWEGPVGSGSAEASRCLQRQADTIMSQDLRVDSGKIPEQLVDVTEGLVMERGSRPELEHQGYGGGGGLVSPEGPTASRGRRPCAPYVVTPSWHLDAQYSQRRGGELLQYGGTEQCSH